VHIIQLLGVIWVDEINDIDQDQENDIDQDQDREAIEDARQNIEGVPQTIAIEHQNIAHHDDPPHLITEDDLDLDEIKKYEISKI